MPIWGHRDSEPPAEGRQESAAPTWESAGEHSDGEPAPTPPPAGVVLDGETAVTDPALTGTSGGVGRTPDPAAGPAATELPEPTVAVAREPAVDQAQGPAVGGAERAASSGVRQPGAAGSAGSAGAPATGAAGPAPAAAAGAPAASGSDAAQAGRSAASAGSAAFSGSAAAASAGGNSPQRWSEILVGFVDDPRGSVQLAANAVDEAIGVLVNSLRARQRELASTWQDAGADTERLRVALREYREFGQRVQRLDPSETPGGPGAAAGVAQRPLPGG